MKKNSLYIILLVLLLVSCDRYKNYRLDGMWQLKTVEDISGNKSTVDTIYYSFQREAIFSLTVLIDPEYAQYPRYGYMDMPSNDKVHILIDRANNNNDNFSQFLSLSGWSSYDITFDIKNDSNNNLVLFDSGNGKTFTLKKF